jgi:hypothetical protein
MSLSTAEEIYLIEYNNFPGLPEAKRRELAAHAASLVVESADGRPALMMRSQKYRPYKNRNEADKVLNLMEIVTCITKMIPRGAGRKLPRRRIVGTVCANLGISENAIKSVFPVSPVKLFIESSHPRYEYLGELCRDIASKCPRPTFREKEDTK